MRFSDIHSIHIAASGELNVCSGDHFRYRIVNNIQPDLNNKSRVDFDLVHVGGALPDITATLRIFEGNILNVKWTWKDKTANKRMFAVPDDYISTESKPLQGDLSKFLRISPNPFSVQFLYDDDSQSEFFSIDGMIYDSYLNWVRTHVVTESGTKFKGIFGLG